MDKKINHSKYIWNGIFVVILLVLLFVPPAKAYVIQGLMQMGLFKPQVTAQNEQKQTDLSGIKFKDAEGNITDLGDLKGKVIFLNFWATWCPPCQAEMPSVEKLYQQFSKDRNVVFLFVDADGNFEKSKKFMDRKKYSLPVYAIGGNIPEEIFKGALPTTIVFDKMSRISYRGEGAANYSDKKFIDFMQKLSDM